jgi:hypothetical protein
LLAIALGLVVLLLFLGFVILGRVNSTLGNPNFYTDRLREADAYNFLYDEAMPLVLDEMGDTFTAGDTTIDMDHLKAKLIPTVRNVLPPEWIQARVEDVFNETIPYVLGDVDQFSITVPIKDRVSDLGETLKDILHDEEVFDDLYEGAVEYAVDQGMEGLEDAPFTIRLTRQEMASTIRTLVPKDWLLEQFDGAVDQMVPYLVGDAEHFAIKVELKSRVDAVVEVAKDMLAEQETYDYIFDKVVAPSVTGNIVGFVELPYGITIEDYEVLDAVKQVLTQAWLEEQMGEMLDEVAAYIKGSSDTFEVVVSLADREVVAMEVIEDLAESKIEKVLNALPACSLAEAAALVLAPPSFGELPNCRPGNFSYQELKDLLGIDFGASIVQLIGIPIPDEFRFGLAEFRQITGHGNEDFLDTAREHVSEGWTYTDADLRDKLGEDDEKRLNDARDWIKNGFTFTEEDLKKLIEGDTDDLFSGPPDAGMPDLANVRFALAEEQTVSAEFTSQFGDNEEISIETVRRWLGLARRWFNTLGWAILAVLSLLVGFLGGRNWYSRLAWAAFPMLVASLVTFVTFGPGFNSLGSDRIRTEFAAQMSEASDLSQVFVDKAVEIATDVLGTFAAGIANQSLIVLAITALLVVGALIAPSYVRRRGEPTQTPY